MTEQISSPKSQPYGRNKARPPGWRVTTYLPADAAAAVREIVERHGLADSGAVHHLVRLGAGLPPLSPLD
jgi:hypothetical protein